MVPLPRSTTMRPFLKASAVLTALLAPGASFAAVIHVPQDYPTIAAGIAASSAGDVIEVACGTYFESNLVMKSGVVLRSMSGLPGCVVIDAQGLAPVMSIPLGANPATTIEGITFARGGGGGLECGTATLRHCRFTDTLSGIALYIRENAIVEDCQITANYGVTGLQTHNAPSFLRCEFSVNGWGANIKNGSPTFRDCAFVSGGGVSHGYPGTPHFIDCRFEDNLANEGGGANIQWSGATFEKRSRQRDASSTETSPTSAVE
jgi:hypothetical protein